MVYGDGNFHHADIVVRLDRAADLGDIERIRALPVGRPRARRPAMTVPFSRWWPRWRSPGPAQISRERLQRRSRSRPTSAGATRELGGESRRRQKAVVRSG